MNLEAVVIPLSYLQKAFLIVSLDYDKEKRRFHLSKWQWLFAIPQTFISISLIWTGIDETIRTTNLISVIRNVNIWVEILLSIIYNVQNTYIERNLGSRIVGDLLSFNDELSSMQPSTGIMQKRHRHNNRNLTTNSTRNVKEFTLRVITICTVTNLLGLLQWLFLATTVADALKHCLLEIPTLMENILVAKWCVYLYVFAEYNKLFLQDMHKCIVNWNSNGWHEIRRRYSRLYFVYRNFVECFASFLVVFVVCQYVRLLWMLYVLTESLILGGRYEFHALYEVVVQIFTLCCVVRPCLRIRYAANEIGRLCSRIYKGKEAQREVLNFQLQILVQDYNVRPHGAMELNGFLITSIFSTLLIYLVLLIQIARL